MTDAAAPRGPLTGRRVLLTRRPEQAAAMADRLRALGATVLHAPALELAAPDDPGPLDRALSHLADFDWVAFTSPNAVRFTAERMRARGLVLPTRRPALASVGPSTSDAIRQHFPGAAVALEPAADFRAEGLLAAFRDHGVAGRRVLLPASDRARDLLASGLRASGALAEQVVAYRTVSRAGADVALAADLAAGVDLVVLASPSAVEGFLAMAGEQGLAVPAAVIGPVTEEAARGAGLTVAVRASPSTADGLVDAVTAHLGGDVTTVDRTAKSP